MTPTQAIREANESRTEHLWGIVCAAGPSLRRAGAVSAAVVGVIAATTLVQISGPLLPQRTAPAVAAMLPSEPPEEVAAYPEGLTDAESETAEELQSTGAALRGGLTPDVRAFADGLYIGIAVWEILPDAPMEEWRIVFANTAASPTLGKDVNACVSRPVLECFPELNNAAGRRYGDLARLSLETRRTVHVGVTRFGQNSGNLNTYFNALAYVDATHVAVLYHVIDGASSVQAGGFALGVDMPAERAVDVQLQVLAAVTAELDHKLEHVENADDGR